MSRPFAQVDVFSARPGLGNPVAVVLDGEGLSDAEMERFARWTNLSETTFVLAPSDPEADYRLRIFTPGGELPFAGHPTLGSAHAWLEHGGVPRRPERLVQECGAGRVQIRHAGASLAFAAPPLIREGEIEDELLERMLDAFALERERVVASQWVDNGPGWAVVRLASAAEVLDLRPDFSRFPEARVGVIGSYPDAAPFAYEIRAFAPGAGVPEDPVTGSLNASVAQWLTRTGAMGRHYLVSQGGCLGRAGEIEITAEDDGTVWVGGATSCMIRGTVAL